MREYALLKGSVCHGVRLHIALTADAYINLASLHVNTSRERKGAKSERSNVWHLAFGVCAYFRPTRKKRNRPTVAQNW